MNMNKQLCETVLEIERELITFAQEQERLTKENDRTWDQLVWMARGYLDRHWEMISNKEGRVYSDEQKTFVDAKTGLVSNPSIMSTQN